MDNRIAQYRQELARVLSSREFSPRRQLCDFLTYVCEAAFHGRTHLEQVEIAEQVLHRGEEFNPLDDASVRKMATLARQRLEAYFTGEGAGDPVVIVLPVRSYVPQFLERNGQAGPQPPASQSPATEASAGSRLPRRALWFAATAALLAAALGFFAGRQSRTRPRGGFVITTVRGDIMHEVNDLPPDGLLLGPEIGLAEQATVRMRFVAERAMQQAGLLAFRNPDNYVKLGRQFLSRTELEFGIETGARYAKPAGTFLFDPAGQDGRPLWLSIRRDRQTFSAFVARDGGEWRPTGNLLTAPPDFSPVRFAIFAHHGRSNTPPAVAEFDRASLGLEFETWLAGPADLARFEGWALRSSCDDSPQPAFDGTGLVFPAGKNASSCLIRFERPVPEGDWEFITKMDFISQSGSTAGLRLDGDRRALRLVRWDVNGGSISAEHLGHAQVNSPDWDGNPPVVLRMQCRNGVVRPSFSRDGEEFRELPLEVGIGSFGKSPTIGIAVTRSSWTRETQPAPAKFYYIRRNLLHLRPYR